MKMLPIFVYFNSLFLDKAMKVEDVVFSENYLVLYETII